MSNSKKNKRYSKNRRSSNSNYRTSSSSHTNSHSISSNARRTSNSSANRKKSKENSKIDKEKTRNFSLDRAKYRKKALKNKYNSGKTQVVKIPTNVKSSKKKRYRNKKKHGFLKALLILFLIILILIGIGVGFFLSVFLSDEFKLNKDDDLTITAYNGKVLDQDGNVLTELAGEENRIKVKMDEMPKSLPDAFVAIEDERFYSHHGIDWKRTIGATLQFVLHKGNSSYGGSTITQQVVKNFMKDDADTGVAGINRKIREMSRAYNVEKILSKQEILELYLNKIFMGGTYYGVGTAAIHYFNKNISDLDLAQCAFIAGINHSPNAYNAFDGKEETQALIKKRTKTVLGKMKELKYIDEQQYKDAVAEVDAGLAFEEGKVNTRVQYSFHTSAAIEQVINDLKELKGISYDAARFIVFNNGYTIYSTQDTSIQDEMENVMFEDTYVTRGRATNSDGSLKNEGHTQAGMTIISQNDGHVVACVGALGSDADSIGFNRATQTKKQTGSSIKPLAAIAPGLESKTITESTVFLDAPTTFGGGYDPGNSSHYSGLMTVRNAIGESSNVVNVKILALTGVSTSNKFLSSVGIDSGVDDLSLTLGSLSTSPLKMAGAYAAIANNGLYIEPTFYTKVVDANGKTILEKQQKQEQVMSVENAFILKDILKAPVESGTATNCTIPGQDVGAKTGSTDNYAERWLCGFTSYYTAACWYGYDNTETQSVFGGNVASKIWVDIMRRIHSGKESAKFEKPETVQEVTVCLTSGLKAKSGCGRTATMYFSPDNMPETCTGHSNATICTETGNIATEYCPETEERYYAGIPEAEQKGREQKLWTTSAISGYTNPPSAKCNVHTQPVKEKIKVPNVIGKQAKAARSTLESAGLSVNMDYNTNKDKANGEVLGQSIASGTSVDKGTSITITVNDYKKPDSTPTPTEKPEETPTPEPTTKPEPTETPTTEPTEGSGEG